MNEWYVGNAAALAGEHVGSSPWPAGDQSPEAAAWRAGWIEGEISRRTRAGTFGEDPAKVAAMRADLAAAGYNRPDPTVILDDPPPDRSWIYGAWYGRTIARVQYCATFRSSTNAFDLAMRALAASLTRTSISIAGLTAAWFVQDEPPACSLPDPPRKDPVPLRTVELAARISCPKTATLRFGVRVLEVDRDALPVVVRADLITAYALERVGYDWTYDPGPLPAAPAGRTCRHGTTGPFCHACSRARPHLVTRRLPRQHR